MRPERNERNSQGQEPLSTTPNGGLERAWGSAGWCFGGVGLRGAGKTSKRHPQQAPCRLPGLGDRRNPPESHDFYAVGPAVHFKSATFMSHMA